MALLALGVLTAASTPAVAGSATSGRRRRRRSARRRRGRSARRSVGKADSRSRLRAPRAQPPPPPPPPPPPAQTTYEKIDAAVASGAITAEQGLIYKVFSSFSDPRLPGQYVGAPDPLAEAPLDDVTARWNQLSDAAKATLGPFLIPPMHNGSYWEQRIQGTPPAATAAPALASPRPSEADPNSPWCHRGTWTSPRRTGATSRRTRDRQRARCASGTRTATRSTDGSAGGRIC